jgi:hypothetical protein
MASSSSSTLGKRTCSHLVDDDDRKIIGVDKNVVRVTKTAKSDSKSAKSEFENGNVLYLPIISFW